MWRDKKDNSVILKIWNTLIAKLVFGVKKIETEMTKVPGKNQRKMDPKILKF